MAEATRQKNRTQRCPICGAPTRREVRPFCSRRCADIDLGRWLRGVYRMPTDEPPGTDDRGGDGRGVDGRGAEDDDGA